MVAGEVGGNGSSADFAAASHHGLTYWNPTANSEERREFYQRRLTLFAKIFFLTFVILLIWVNVMYWLEPMLAPRNYQAINLVSILGLVALGLVWRLLFVRRDLTQRALFAWDTVFTVVVGVVLGFSGAVSWDKEANVASMLVWALFMVFARVSIIPSRGNRTMWITAGALAPQIACSIYIVSVIDAPLYMGTPRLAYVIGCTIYAGVAVLLAGLGSEVLFGLRKQVAEVAQLGQYSLVEKIGEGGMGTVYKARQAMLRRPTALKLFSPAKAGSLERFAREVQLTSELTSPHTVRIYDYGRSPDGIFYYTMEYLEGINLERLVHRHGPQPAARVIHILAQVCDALDEAHDRGLIHRDVKPANVMLCVRGKNPDFVKVLDFGLVKQVEEAAGKSSEVIVGSLPYMSPEAFLAPEKIGPASDIYAVGATAFFLLTGRVVFPAKTSVEMAMNHVKTAPTPPAELVAGVPEGLDRLILDCLAKKPEDRPGSAVELRERLLAVDVPPWAIEEARQWWEKNPFEPSGDGSDEPSIITVDWSRRHLNAPESDDDS